MELLDRSIVDKLAAQAALQPGVGMVVRDLLRQGRGVVQFRCACGWLLRQLRLAAAC